jgi:hypothetical protein
MIKCSNIGDAEPGGAMVVVVVCCCLRRLLLFVAAHVGVGYCDAHAMRTGRHGSSCGLLFITTPLYVGKQYCDAPLMRTHPPVMKVGFFLLFSTGTTPSLVRMWLDTLAGPNTTVMRIRCAPTLQARRS